MSGSVHTADPAIGVQRDHDLGGPMITVENLKERFPLFEGILQKKTGEVRAVDDVSFPIAEGETFGLVGELGSSKATTGRSMLHLTGPTSGWAEIDGQNVVDFSDGELKQFRRNMQTVHQDLSSSLDPRHRVKSIIETPLKIHDYGDPEARLERIEELLGMMDPPREFMYRYPGQSSDDQRQRVDITHTVAPNPKLVVLDEPTSTLDVGVQARIVNILGGIQEEFDVACLFVTHDLSPLRSVADRIDVIHLGRLVEVGDVGSVFGPPQRPHSRAPLSTISAISEEDELAKPDRIAFDDEVPDPREKPSDYAFYSHCAHEFDACAVEEPELYKRGVNQVARYFLRNDRLRKGTEWK